MNQMFMMILAREHGDKYDDLTLAMSLLENKNGHEMTVEEFKQFLKNHA